MTNLYTNLSAIYEAMYQSFINYQEEYDFYSGLLTKYKCKSLLEVGCGSGNLASRFAQGGFNYTGMDLSDDMLSIAKQNNPQAVFINGDMRDFNLQKKVDACIITGRTISYLISNKDVQDCFYSIGRNFKKTGILCFDFINAEKFIPLIDPAEKITHTAIFENKQYQRNSFWSVNKLQNGIFDWASVYYEETANGELLKIGEDNSTIRAFYKNDITDFLVQSGFKINEIMERPSYAFDTLVIVAEKINT
jgi:SAM-dependent methyltransferase